MVRQRAAIVLALLAAFFPALGAVGPAATAGFANVASAAGAVSVKAPPPGLSARAGDGSGAQPITWSAQVAAPRTVPACDDATDVDPGATAPALGAPSQLGKGAVVPRGWHSTDRAGRGPGSRGPPCSVRF